MLNFLKKSRQFLNATDAICIIIGNESCDLDSAVCAISLAYFYQHLRSAQTITKSKQFLPVLNIPRRDYPLKTEVNFLFKQFAINESDLTFRDELNEDLIARSDFILVDHHVSPFSARCVEVFDHRPYDATACLPKSCCKINIDLVGSCATLIGELFLKEIDNDLSQVDNSATILSLIRNTIILDTVNFSVEAARSTPRDHIVCENLEKILINNDNYLERNDVFRLLCKARADISSLTPIELLRKDMKILSNPNNIRIALPGFPLLVQNFIDKPGADEAIKEFVKEFDVSVVLLIGMFVYDEDKSVSRDLGLININNSQLYEAVLQRISNLKDPDLQLQHLENSTFMRGHFFKQNNIKATRKHILPVVKSVLEECGKK